jgi:hypothetical protein
MARPARVVVPDIPHHITQRGNRHLKTFPAKPDYREYLIAEWCNRLTMMPFWLGLEGDCPHTEEAETRPEEK